MYKKILVPLDGSALSEQILPYAGRIAEDFNIPVELLLVVDPASRSPFSEARQALDYLNRVRRDALPAWLSVGCHELRGRAAEAILDHARADPGCLIALATHGLTGARRWLLGSVAAKVVQAATDPLLLIRPGDGGVAGRVELSTVIVPLDGSGLAERVLPHVVALARTMQLEVQLVRIYTLPADAYVVGDGVYREPWSRYRDALREEAEVYLENKASQLRAEGVSAVLPVAVEGDPASVIIDFGRTTRHNLIAMTTHGRSGLGRWMLGSVAERVIQHSRDPVLIVRP